VMLTTTMMVMFFVRESLPKLY